MEGKPITGISMRVTSLSREISQLILINLPSPSLGSSLRGTHRYYSILTPGIIIRKTAKNFNCDIEPTITSSVLILLQHTSEVSLLQLNRDLSLIRGVTTSHVHLQFFLSTQSHRNINFRNPTTSYETVTVL